MRTGTLVVAVALSIALAAPAWGGEAGTAALKSMTAWMSESGVFLSRPVRDGIAGAADQAFASLTADGSIAPDRVLTKIDPAVRAYADMIVSEKKVPDFAAVLLEEVKPGGFWAPWPKEWPLVTLSASLPPDRVLIDGDRAESRGYKYNVKVGSVRFTVEKSGYESCIETLMTESGKDYDITCVFKRKTATPTGSQCDEETVLTSIQQCFQQKNKNSTYTTERVLRERKTIIDGILGRDRDAFVSGMQGCNMPDRPADKVFASLTGCDDAVLSRLSGRLFPRQ